MARRNCRKCGADFEAFIAHRAARLNDQAGVRWLTEFVAVALMTIAMALAWFA